MSAVEIAFVIGAYLLGSVSFAVIVSRFFRLDDPRTYGSKNPGATNVLRSGKKLAAVLTLLGDALKGWLAVLLVRLVGDPAITHVGVAPASLALSRTLLRLLIDGQVGRGVQGSAMEAACAEDEGATKTPKSKRLRWHGT